MYYHEKENHYDSKHDSIYKHYGSRKKEHCKADCHKDKHRDENRNKHKEGCVEEILEAILKAQRKAEKKHKKKTTSCKQSFEELLEEPKVFNKNTIPFVLYCGCEPFKAVGVTTCPAGPKGEKFLAITSFIFKIKELKGGCAKLELLAFKSKKHADKKVFSPSDQINHQYVKDLIKTGICITVDLSCFCGITYLPAVRL